jgi:ParB-like chromosome segregation protein Spo0J
VAHKLEVIAALATLELLEAEDVSSRGIQDRLGIDRFELSHLRRLKRQLTPASRQVIERARLSFAHARAIARLRGDDQETLARDVAQRRWSAHRAEREARERLQGRAAGPDNSMYVALAEQIAEQIGHPVQIRTDPANPRRGEILVTFADLDCFDAILSRMRVSLGDNE